mmetsp:Transcript_50611/g.120732  ORF Transcript_50611/g.120732 Transcript_50611/m.120732 type:complete len:82 (-) Transcript_50611:1793-2038(-)
MFETDTWNCGASLCFPMKWNPWPNAFSAARECKTGEEAVLRVNKHYKPIESNSFVLTTYSPPKAHPKFSFFYTSHGLGKTL